MSEQRRKKRYIFIPALTLIILLIGGAGFTGYRLLYTPDFHNEETIYIHIESGETFDDLCRQLTDSANCSRIEGFKWLACLLQYPEQMKNGRYAITPGMTHWELLRKLRRGEQAALRITFNNIRLLDELAAQFDGQLMVSREELLALLRDSAYCRSLGFTAETIATLFIPNTYEIYWNITAENLLQRMKWEYDAFWTEERRAKAAALRLTPVEVAILASIVEEETAETDEYPIIAGLYLNRLRRDIPLQADPSVKFAVGNFSLQRILFRHIEIDSPYNTYKYTGLPPGPLRIPSIKGLDSVLNYTQHDYIYMCAKEDFSGRHNFAVTLAEHNRNARRYHAALDGKASNKQAYN
jgi:UPF0755 protein